MMGLVERSERAADATVPARISPDGKEGGLNPQEGGQLADVSVREESWRRRASGNHPRIAAARGQDMRPRRPNERRRKMHAGRRRNHAIERAVVLDTGIVSRPATRIAGASLPFGSSLTVLLVAVGHASRCGRRAGLRALLCGAKNRAGHSVDGHRVERNQQDRGGKTVPQLRVTGPAPHPLQYIAPRHAAQRISRRPPEPRR